MKIITFLFLVSLAIAEEDFLSKDIFQSFTITAIKFYQKNISPLKVSSCRYTPSCSNYSLQAIRNYGTTIGILMTADRLLRCNRWGEWGYDPPQKHYIFASYREDKIYEGLFYEDVKSESSVFSFADKLFEEKLYEEALIEYKRVLFENKNLSYDEKLFGEWMVAICYYKLKKYQKALDIFESLYSKIENGHNLKPKLLFIRAKIYYQLNSFSLARESLDEIVKISKDKMGVIKAYILIAICWLEEENFIKAFEVFSNIVDKFPDIKEIQKIRLIKEEIAEFEKKFNKKSKVAAGILSIIPGLGKIYAGKPKDGIFTFGFISALGYLSYEGIKNEFYLFGGLLSILTFNFYLGNIYGGIDAAVDYNRKNVLAFKEYIKNELKIFFEDIFLEKL